MDNETAARRIRLTGVTQGVGFRPAMARHAAACGVAGSARNTPGGVEIRIRGSVGAVERFLRGLSDAAPPPARIESIRIDPLTDADAPESRGFSIAPSGFDDIPAPAIPPDLALCDDCLAEMRGEGRRADYPFIACAQCGPRFTIIEALPYDRERTSMADFELCAKCISEYENIADRRCHAECQSCPTCGPQLQFRDKSKHLFTKDAMRAAIECLKAGMVGAVKGVGGFHLVCDAMQAAPIQRLRDRKRRPRKPFAAMARSIGVAARHVEISEAEREFLASNARPIVLLRWRRGVERPDPDLLAPGNARLGVMLPYAPIHELLMREFEWLVMTSANESEEPIAREAAEIDHWLGDSIDFILDHDRRITQRCDDSVALLHETRPVLIRRARGYAPRPMRASNRANLPPILACGGDLKNVFALGREGMACLSTHMGDLEHPVALSHFEDAIAAWSDLLDIRPEAVVHDLHPGYHSTQYAQRRPERRIAVQHHHAHLAACLAEHDLDGPAIGVILDGSGYGPDGTIWGGEVLIGDASEFRRAARLKPLPLPGGDKAIRQPWRSALTHWVDALGAERAVRIVADRAVTSGASSRIEDIEALARTLASEADFPRTSSAGRAFDAMAFLLGAPSESSFEAEHPQWLEKLANEASDSIEAPAKLTSGSDGLIDIDLAPAWRVWIDALNAGVAPATVARSFHETWIDVIVEVCERLSGETGLRLAACSGGCFLNARFALGLEARFRAAGFTPFFHRETPPGDGCLALGQLSVAWARLETARG